MKTNNIYYGITAAIIIVSGFFFNIVPQINFSSKDSLYFESVKDDTSKLRELTNHFESEVCLKAHDRLGFINFKSGNYNASESEYRFLKNNSPDSKEGKEALFFIGRLESFKGNAEEAKQSYENYLGTVKKGQWTQGAKYFLITQLMKLNDPSSLQKIREFLTEYPPDSAYSNHAQFQVIQYYKKQKDYINAALEAKKLVSIYPNSPYTEDMKYQIGDFLYNAGKSGEAKSYYRALIKDNKLNTEPAAIGQYLLGEIYDKDGDYDNARLEYKKVKQDNPSINNWLVLSDFAIALSYYNESLEVKDTSNIKPDSVKLNTSKELFEKFIIDYPTDKRTPRAEMTLADIYKQRNEYDKALEVYNNIISFNIDNMTNVSKDYKEKEIASYKELSINARFAKALLLRNELNNSGHPDALSDALNEYKTILQEYPDSKEAKLGEAVTLLDLNKVDEGIYILKSLSVENSPEGETAKSLLENFISQQSTNGKGDN